MKPEFHAEATFSRAEWALLPFRFERLSQDNVLLTSEAGEHAVIPSDDFDALVSGQLPIASDTARLLQGRQIIYTGDPRTAARLAAAKLRTRKSFLREGAGLHIFVVTLGCDHGCHYCQVSRQLGGGGVFDMSSAIAASSVDLMFQSSASNLTVEFQGGEPLLAMPLIRRIVDLVEQRNRTERRTLTYTITSTLHHADVEVLAFLRDYGFQVSTSLDGPAKLHDANRPLRNASSHDLTLRGIERARRALGEYSVSALTTITRRSLDYPVEIVSEYLRLGFQSIFLRPVAPFGFAARSQRSVGYRPQEFLRFYMRALSHIIAVNRAGAHFEEAYAKLLLSSILTPFPTGYVDLRSPAGAGFGALVYNYDGGVYASDEGRMLHEMGEDALRLGHVDQPLSDLIQSPAMNLVTAAGWAEALPGCSDCAFLPFCGPDVAGAIASEKDPVGHRATSSHCIRHLGLFRTLFEHLQDPCTRSIFEDWVFGPALGGAPQ